MQDFLFNKRGSLVQKFLGYYKKYICKLRLGMIKITEELLREYLF